MSTTEINKHSKAKNRRMTCLRVYLQCQQYDRVTVEVKVLRVINYLTLSNGKKKQEIIITDDSGNATISLWQSDIGKLIENKSYRLNRIQLHSYAGKISLNYPSHGALIELIEDLENVCSAEDDEEETQQVIDAIIVGVNQLESASR